MRRVRALLVEVALRADVVRDAPGDAPVATEDDARRPRISGPRHVEPSADQVGLIPAARRAEGDVRIADHERPAGNAAARADDPVVAAGAVVDPAQRRLHRVRAAARARVLAGMQNRLVDRLGGREGAEQRAIAQGAPGQLGHRNHRKPPREIPAKLAQQRNRIERPPRLRPIVEQVELDRRQVAAVLDERVHAGREGLVARGRLGRQARRFVGRDSVQPDRSHQHVVVERLGAQDFRQTPQRPPPQIVHLEQPVLGHRVAVPHEQVGLFFGIDMRQAADVPLDLNRCADRACRPPVGHRQPALKLLVPPGLELSFRQPGRGANDRQPTRRGPIGAGSGVSRWPWCLLPGVPVQA